jgi:hypothetical protein
MSKSVLLQDYHDILSKIMEGMVKIQQGGLIWDFMYHGKVHHNMIKDLIRNNDQDGLKAISQHLLHNVWYLLNFGAHSNEGVHGARPLEMLHALLLGIFKYVRDMFWWVLPVIYGHKLPNIPIRGVVIMP